MTDTTISDAPAAPVAFVGRRGSLFWLVLRNTFFNLITLSIYRFWAKTWLRRYFWHGLAIDGEALEYTGRPVELLLGFLIVLAVLIPLGIVYSGLSVTLTTNAPAVAPFVDLIYFTVLLVLTPYALYRARRYRLTRTVWRGVRCGQDGSPVRYAFLFVAYWLLNIVTLGIAVPWMRTALQRFRMNNTRFGDRNFSFDGRGGALFLRWLPVLACIVAGYGLILWGSLGPIAIMIENAEFLGGDAVDLIDQQDFDWAQIGMGIALIFAAVLLYIRYRVGEFRYFASVTSLGEICFRSYLHAGHVLLIGLIYYVLLFGLIGVMIVFVSVAVINFDQPSSAMQGGALMPIIGLALVYLFGLPALKHVALYLPLAQYVSRTLQVTNMNHVATIVQDIQAQPRYGEGLADALDADVGVF